MSAEALYVIT